MTNYLYSVVLGERNDLTARVVLFVLRLFSLVYGLVIMAKNALFALGIWPSRKLSKPVISIGNITWGGVGKTPLVIWLAKYIQQQGLRPAILMRGYKGRSGELSSAYTNDEALMIQEVLSDVAIGINKNRIAAAHDLIREKNVDVFLLDDGFQHRQVKRDLDLVVIDATNPFGNDWMIPGGSLREPLMTLRRADVLIVTKINLVDSGALQRLEERLKKIHPQALLVKSMHAPMELENLVTKEQRPLSSLVGQTIMACSSIGDPRGFEVTLQKCGVQVQRSFRFLDHHWYTAQEVERMVEECRQARIRVFITTAKDAVKLRDFSSLFKDSLSCLILKIDFQITENQNELLARIIQLLRR